MRYFYAFMLYWTDFELTVARTHSSNLAYIRMLTKDLLTWESLLAKELSQKA